MSVIIFMMLITGECITHSDQRSKAGKSFFFRSIQFPPELHSLCWCWWCWIADADDANEDDEADADDHNDDEVDDDDDSISAKSALAVLMMMIIYGGEISGRGRLK